MKPTLKGYFLAAELVAFAAAWTWFCGWLIGGGWSTNSFILCVAVMALTQACCVGEELKKGR